ncbi:MAG: hypothetical protein P1U74_11470 [Legionellaceae bacterium]|nr:hypothetical protein [Legionellaceae bacterium]
MDKVVSFLISTIQNLYQYENNNLKTLSQRKFNDTQEIRDKLARFFKATRYSSQESVMDVPQVLSNSIKDSFYKSFNQMSNKCGTGELSLHYYTEIKCSKYHVAYEDGIGLSTAFILSAMVENAKQDRHYHENQVQYLILNDTYFKEDKKPVFYIDIRDTEQNYLQSVKDLLSEINDESLVEIIYLKDEHYNDISYIKSVFEKSQFINLDKSSNCKYWENIFTYYGFDKLVCIHHLGYLYPLIEREKLSNLLFEKEYNLVLYPIVEKNKHFQNGCLKFLFVNCNKDEFYHTEELKEKDMVEFIKDKLDKY